jgi:hypothetical protein
LGAKRIAKVVREELRSVGKVDFSDLLVKSDSELYFLKYWSEREGSAVSDLARDWLSNPDQWNTRLGNHGFASLHWLSKGRKGARIRKYYCGLRVYLALPGGNIRYFLELIDAAIDHQLDSEGDQWRSSLALSPKAQTLAARDVGKRRLNQLEGLADHGVELKRLVLGIGRVFFEFARSPIKRAPEVTAFVISGEIQYQKKIRSLLSEGVGHLAFVVAPRTKATSSETKDDEYRLHPIFSAFFEISHRRKRRTTFDAADLCNLLNAPSKAISALTGRAVQSAEEALPEQLAFFSAFYEGG